VTTDRNHRSSWERKRRVKTARTDQKPNSRHMGTKVLSHKVGQGRRTTLGHKSENGANSEAAEGVGWRGWMVVTKRQSRPNIAQGKREGFGDESALAQVRGRSQGKRRQKRTFAA